MIIGCGIDSIEIERVEEMLRDFSTRFEKRVFTQPERDRASQKAVSEKASYYAKRFAAKEAALKAMGVGLQNGLSWQDLEISSTFLGQPLLTLSPKGLTILKNQYVDCKGFFRFHVSLCDTKEYAQAMVILELAP